MSGNEEFQRDDYFNSWESEPLQVPWIDVDPYREHEIPDHYKLCEGCGQWYVNVELEPDCMCVDCMNSQDSFEEDLYKNSFEELDNRRWDDLKGMG